MNRRSILKLFAAAAITGCNLRQDAAQDMRVVVAGAGIIGASIAWHLAKAGAEITVIEKQAPASHASRGTFAWINATWAKQPRHYHALNQESVASWKDLQQTLDLPVRWGGSLEWFDSAARQQQLAQQIAEQHEWGEQARMLGPGEFSALEPQVEFGDARHFAYSGNDGAVDPVAATEALLAAAQGLGASVRYPCELTDVSLRSGRLEAVDTSLGMIEADRLVLATGAAPDAGKTFARCDIPQRSTPGIIAVTAPMPRLINHVITAPGVHMHQREDGRIVLGEQRGAPDNQAHAARLQGRPNDFPGEAIAQEHASRMLAVAQRFVPGMAGAAIDEAYIGWRPLPLDGHPVLGRSPARPDVYIAVMHSGVSLAPVVGQLVASELAHGTDIDRLDAFRLDRDFRMIKRY